MELEEKLRLLICEVAQRDTNLWSEISQLDEPSKPQKLKDFKKYEERNYYRWCIKTCELICKIEPRNKKAISLKREFSKILGQIEQNYPMSNYNFQEIITEINNAFFRLESFMNGSISNYQYFGFNEAFTKLFNEAIKPENFTYNNCKLIGKYWDLTEQIRVDFDQSNFENSEAYENEDFCEDCNEIMYVNWDRIDEFMVFSTPDEIAEAERKFSITDILKAPALPPQPIVKRKPEQETPKTFDELFYNTDLVKPCIDILKELDPPLIDTDCNYIGKLKGIVCVWIDELQKQGIVKHYSDRKIFASLTPQKIKRFSIDESMFGKYQSKAENQYRTDIKTKVSDIKLSQNSQ